jgi:hypothetical protein
MAKKITMACMALVALAAFALPATASASPELTHPTGTTYCPKDEAGKECLVTGTNVGDWVLAGPFGTNVTCSKVALTGTITENSGKSVKGDITSATFNGTGEGGDCTSTLGSVRVTTTVGNGTPWCLTANSEMAADEFQVRGNACTAASRSITFVLDFTGGPTCYYNRTAVVKGTFATDTAGQDAVLSFTEQEWVLEKGENETFLKPCLTSGKLTGAATLETDTTASNDPMYIS